MHQHCDIRIQYGTVPFRYNDDILVRAFKTPQDFAQWQHRMALWQPSSHPRAMGHPMVRGFQGFTAGNWQQKNTSTKSPFELNQTSLVPDSDLSLHLNNLNSTPPVFGIAKNYVRYVWCVKDRWCCGRTSFRCQSFHWVHPRSCPMDRQGRGHLKADER